MAAAVPVRFAGMDLVEMMRHVQPVENELLQYLWMTNKDSTGVLVVLHAFKLAMLEINKKTGDDVWFARRQNISGDKHFKSLYDIPEGYDWEYAFANQARTKRAAHAAAIVAVPAPVPDEFPARCWLRDGLPMIPDTIMTGDAKTDIDVPQWLDPERLLDDFWPQCTYQKPDGVIRIDYRDEIGNKRFFRVFVEIDGNSKHLEVGTIAHGRKIFESCEACWHVNQDVPAFTMRVNYANYTRNIFDTVRAKLASSLREKGQEAALEIYFETFQPIKIAVQAILMELQTSFGAPRHADTRLSRHLFVMMPRKSRASYDFTIANGAPLARWYAGGGQAHEHVFSDDAGHGLPSVFDITGNPACEYTEIDREYSIHMEGLRHRSARPAVQDADMIPTLGYWTTLAGIVPTSNPDTIMNRSKTSPGAIPLLHWQAIFGDEVRAATYKPQYDRYDHVMYRVVEQGVVYVQNYMNVISHRYRWGRGRPMKWVFDILAMTMNASPDAMMSRTMIPLDRRQYFHNLSFVDPKGRFTAKLPQSLQARLCQDMYFHLPALEVHMQAFVRQFNIPNAELFLRMIRCNNVIALRELARQYFSGKIDKRVDVVLKTLPACTESEIRWLFAYTLQNAFYMSKAAREHAIANMQTGRPLGLTFGLPSDSFVNEGGESGESGESESGESGESDGGDGGERGESDESGGGRTSNESRPDDNEMSALGTEMRRDDDEISALMAEMDAMFSNIGM